MEVRMVQQVVLAVDQVVVVNKVVLEVPEILLQLVLLKEIMVVHL
tara:strand:- start:266 stop:400 length:135 start_codon:yes stop_codon:yes gene_type:complete